MFLGGFLCTSVRRLRVFGLCSWLLPCAWVYQFPLLLRKARALRKYLWSPAMHRSTVLEMSQSTTAIILLEGLQYTELLLVRGKYWNFRSITVLIRTLRRLLSKLPKMVDGGRARLLQFPEGKVLRSIPWLAIATARFIP